jgi:hypothetical protein
MGPARTNAVTALRRRIPASEFWHWWFVAVVCGSRAGGARGGLPRAAKQPHRPVLKLKDAEVKPRRRLVLRTSTRSITRGMPGATVARLCAASGRSC